jgi:hypothetical protein
VILGTTGVPVLVGGAVTDEETGAAQSAGWGEVCADAPEAISPLASQRLDQDAVDDPRRGMK